MFAYHRKTLLAATAIALSGLALAPAGAQVTTGTSGGVTGQDVNASTCGSGTTDQNSLTVSGCADAEARDGGTVNTSTKAQTNDQRAMQRSVATARDADERARSRTHTVVRKGTVVRSRTMSMYKQRGEKPVREVVSSTATPQGTTTTPPKTQPKN